MKILHQFLQEEYYIPTWKIKFLFIGTFNPICGEKVDYYYRRPSNGFWKILEKYNTNDKFDFSTFHGIRKFMTETEFGCIDIINSVTFPDSDKNEICGIGYTDRNLFRVKNYNREYNINGLKGLIEKNDISHIFSTWGKRDKPNEFRVIVQEINRICANKNIVFKNLSSPSGRLYRGNQKNIINNNWYDNLDDLFSGSLNQAKR